MADPTQSHNTIDTVHPPFDEVSEGNSSIPRYLLHIVTHPCTILDLSLDTGFEDKRFDPTFIALSLSLIPTLEKIRFYNVILPSSTNGPCHSKAHLPNLRSLSLIENGSGIVALLSQLSIPTNTVLDLEANTDTPLTTSVELIATVGHILEGSGGAVTQILQTLSLLTEYGRVIVKGYDYFLDYNDPGSPADVRLSMPALNWRDRNGLVEGIAYGLPISRVEIVYSDTSLLDTLSDDILSLLLWSLCNLKSLTWTDPDFPVCPGGNDERSRESRVDMRAGGVSKLATSLCLVQNTVDNEIYRDAVTRLLVLCTLAGFGIDDLSLGLEKS